MSGLLHDLRFGLRLLGRSPVFTATSVLLLAIGISANTLIFSAVNALLLRRLPVTRPEELVRVVQVYPTDFVTWDHSHGLCAALVERRPNFSQVLCQGQADVALADRDTTERVRVHLVSPNFFSDLGVRAVLGRALAPEDERAEVTPAVLSYPFWRRRFQSDPAIIGRNIILNGLPFVVVGVSPENFNGLNVETSPDVRVPLTADRRLAPVFEQMFARLRPGMTLERAQTDAEPLLQSAYRDLLVRQSSDQAENARKWRFRLEPIAKGVSVLREQFRNGLAALMAAVGLLLVMACANVAGLLLARSAVRAPEIGIRLALGASRWRVTRQLFSESLLLALLGGIVGMLLTYACLPVLAGALPSIRDRAAVLQPLAVHLEVDLRVLAFAVATILLSTVFFGASPALVGARTEVVQALRSGRTTTRRLSLHKLIVVAQVATCTLLLVGAALLLETLQRMRSLDPGFDPDPIASFTLDPLMKGYDAGRALVLSRQMLERVRSLPLVAAASIANRALMRGTGRKATIAPGGESVGRDDFLNCSTNSVEPGYFETMGMRLIAGRNFTSFDRNQRKPTKVIVNQASARRFFPNENPIGRRLGMGAPGTVAAPDMEIIGVVSDAKYRSLREGIHPTVYGLMDSGFQYGFTLYIRTHQRPEAIIGSVREILRSLDPELPFVEVHTLRQEVETSLWQERLLAVLTSIFGAIALLVASIGLYGALDYSVKARTREIGVRAALGAEPARIARLLWGETMLLVAAGVVLGFAAHAALAGLLRPLLYEVQPSNPVALTSALLLVTTAAFLAALPPLLRAIRIDPAAALRQE